MAVRLREVPALLERVREDVLGVEPEPVVEREQVVEELLASSVRSRIASASTSQNVQTVKAACGIPKSSGDEYRQAPVDRSRARVASTCEVARGSSGAKVSEVHREQERGVELAPTGDLGQGADLVVPAAVSSGSPARRSTSRARAASSSAPSASATSTARLAPAQCMSTEKLCSRLRSRNSQRPASGSSSRASIW